MRGGRESERERERVREREREREREENKKAYRNIYFFFTMLIALRAPTPK